MIVLDTNVLSELMRTEPNDAVLRWVSAQPASSLFITAVTQAEVLYGLALLAEGARRTALEDAAERMFAEDFAGRILSFDGAAAREFAALTAERRRTGRPIAQFDAQIAAMARSRGAAVATRNVSDFEGCGIGVINPWSL